MRTLIALLTALSCAAGLVACSSSAYCDRSSRCKNQPAVDKSDGGACATSLAQYPQCRSQNEAWLSCQMDHEVCGMDGKTDPNATYGYAISACASQKQALDTCVATDGGSK